MTFDAEALAAVEAGGLDRAVPWVLMASYLYYHHDVGLLSDAVYDNLARRVQARFSELTHPHKHALASLVGQRSVSLFDLPESAYPARAKYAACRLARGLGFATYPKSDQPQQTERRR